MAVSLWCSATIHVLLFLLLLWQISSSFSSRSTDEGIVRSKRRWTTLMSQSRSSRWCGSFGRRPRRRPMRSPSPPRRCLLRFPFVIPNLSDRPHDYSSILTLVFLIKCSSLLFPSLGWHLVLVSSVGMLSNSWIFSSLFCLFPVMLHAGFVSPRGNSQGGSLVVVLLVLIHWCLSSRILTEKNICCRRLPVLIPSTN